MIHEVDEAIRTLVRREVAETADVDVLFEAPTKEWAARRNAPTVDAYLYDIREDLRRRQHGMIDVHDAERRVIARRRPVRFYKLSYLLTAWTQRPEDEHRLLASLLACFLRWDHLPPDVLVGGLAEDEASIALTMAIPPPEDRALSDVWSALGGELKPSLDLVVYVPVDVDRLLGAGPPVTVPPRFRIDGGDGFGAEEVSADARTGDAAVGAPADGPT